MGSSQLQSSTASYEHGARDDRSNEWSLPPTSFNPVPPESHAVAHVNGSYKSRVYSKRDAISRELWITRPHFCEATQGY